MSLSPEISEQRRKGISATDAAPILGLSPWKSPAEVWLEKKKPHLVENKESKSLYWGCKLEHSIAEEYAKVTQQELESSHLLKNAKLPWMMCSPDRTIKGRRKGVECKTANDKNSYQWGPSGTDKIPQYYRIQVEHSMMVTNFDEWDVAVLIGGQEFRVYHIFKDKDLMKVIFQQEHEFYKRFIAGSETPEFDWGKGVADMLRKKYPSHNVGEEFSVDEVGNEELKKALLDLLKARSELVSLEKIEATQKALIQSYMRTSEIMEWKDKKIRITFRQAKGTIKVDWKAVFEEMFPHLNLSAEEKQAIIDRHSEEKDGSRRFLIKDENCTDEDE